MKALRHLCFPSLIFSTPRQNIHTFLITVRSKSVKMCSLNRSVWMSLTLQKYLYNTPMYCRLYQGICELRNTQKPRLFRFVRSTTWAEQSTKLKCFDSSFLTEMNITCTKWTPKNSITVHRHIVVSLETHLSSPVRLKLVQLDRLDPVPPCHPLEYVYCPACS